MAGKIWPRRQHVVVDRASTNGTLEVLQSEPDRGVYGALNKGFALAMGYVLGLLHTDDLYAHPQVLVAMRLGGASNKSLRNVLRKTAEDWRALRQAKVGAQGGVSALVWKNLSKLSQFR